MSDLKKDAPKHDVLADQVTAVPGVSEVGIEIRRADKKNPGLVSHGYARVSDPENHAKRAKSHLKNIVNALKAQPKPNLTRSEIEEFNETLVKADYWSKKISQVKQDKEQVRQKQLEQHFGAKNQAVPEHLKAPPQSTELNYKKLGQEFQQKNKARNTQQSSPVQAVSKPAPAPSVQPATGVTKLHDPDLSGTVAYKPTKKLTASEKKAKVIPTQISEPMIINQPYITSTPKKISGPNEMNQQRDKMKKNNHASTLKRMAHSLTKVDPKTRLPGVLMNKTNEHEKGVNKPFAPGDGAAGISSQGYTVRGAMAIRGADKGMEFRQPHGGPKYDRKLAQDKAKETLADLKAMPKPNLPGSKVEKNINLSPNLSMSEALHKMTKCMSKTLTASEKLSKPYKSDAQRKKIHAMENRGEISHATVKEFDEASKGKKLPEHVSKADLGYSDKKINPKDPILSDKPAAAKPPTAEHIEKMKSYLDKKKMTKSEIETDSSLIKSMWTKRIEKATPAAAPAPAPAKPMMPKMQQPKMNTPKPPAPAKPKMPEMHMSQDDAAPAMNTYMMPAMNTYMMPATNTVKIRLHNALKSLTKKSHGHNPTDVKKSAKTK